MIRWQMPFTRSKPSGQRSSSVWRRLPNAVVTVALTCWVVDWATSLNASLANAAFEKAPVPFGLVLVILVQVPPLSVMPVWPVMALGQKIVCARAD